VKSKANPSTSNIVNVKHPNKRIREGLYHSYVLYTTYMNTGTKRHQGIQETISDTDVCPHLGLAHDPTTSLAYPHPANFCHNATPPCSIALHYQQRTCLTPDFKNCPGFASGWKGLPPEDLQGEEISNQPRIPMSAWLAIPVVILAAILWVGVRLVNRNSANSGIAGVVPSKTNSVTTADLGSLLSKTPEAVAPIETSITETPTPSPSPSMTPPKPTETLPPTPTEQPSPTPTVGSPTLGPLLQTPFGPGNRFVLHELKAGESLSSLANLYDTTNQVIIAANVFIEGASIWPGNILVILPGEKNPANILKFKVIFTETETTVKDLALEYESDPDEIRLYNSLGPEEAIPAGRYLIIPVAQG
jgi:hypothetical protein